MIGKAIRGFGNAVESGLTAAADAAKAGTDIIADYADGEELNQENVDRLIKSGVEVAEIASLFGVATHVIEEMRSEGARD